jgi:hypothetical protein
MDVGMRFEDIRDYSEEIYNTLIELLKTPGPSFSCARTLENKEKGIKEYPMTKKIKEIIGKFEKECDIKLVEDHGNIVLIGGLDLNNAAEEDIRNIPIVLGAHLDEITFLVTNKIRDDNKVLYPLCSPPTRDFIHREAKVLGLRNGELQSICDGKLYAEEIRKIGRDGSVQIENWRYLLKAEKPEQVLPGDVVTQNYMEIKGYVGPQSVIASKALDDRVGVVSVLYALRFLSKHMPIKAILSGDEEGFPRDTSWARLILPTYRRFCRHDVITILCDGVNGADIKEYPEDNENFLPHALFVPYTAEGKGGGDYRLFSIIKEKVVPICEKNDFKIRTLTDYVSRSFDPKIMNEYPLITFIDWSNGLVNNPYFKCHYHEEILFEQVLNIIGCIFWACTYLKENYAKFPL